MVFKSPRPIPPALLADYAEFLAEERQRGAREIALLAFTLYLLFGILDIWAIPSALYEVWTIRLVVAACILVFYGLTYHPVFLRHYAALMIGFFLVLGLGIEGMVYLASDTDVAQKAYYTGMILVLIALHTWPSLPAWQNSLAGAVLILIYLSIALIIHDMAAPEQWPTLLANIFFFVSANIIGHFASLSRERYLHDNFLLHHNLLGDLNRVAREKTLATYWSEHDPLTGLPNRNYLLQHLRQRLQKGAGHSTLALLFIDLDGFKAVNDRLGHAAGDEVLKAIGQRILSSVREQDLFARIGGDEFIVVLELPRRDDAVVEAIARAIIAQVEQPIRAPALDLSLSASIGVAYYPEQAQNIEDLIRLADQQMYEAKKSGRGSVRIANAEAANMETDAASGSSA